MRKEEALALAMLLQRLVLGADSLPSLIYPHSTRIDQGAPKVVSALREKVGAAVVRHLSTGAGPGAIIRTVAHSRMIPTIPPAVRLLGPVMKVVEENAGKRDRATVRLFDAEVEVFSTTPPFLVLLDPRLTEEDFVLETSAYAVANALFSLWQFVYWPIGVPPAVRLDLGKVLGRETWRKLRRLAGVVARIIERGEYEAGRGLIVVDRDDFDREANRAGLSEDDLRTFHLVGVLWEGGDCVVIYLWNLVYALYGAEWSKKVEGESPYFPVTAGPAALNPVELGVLGRLWDVYNVFRHVFSGEKLIRELSIWYTSRLLAQYEVIGRSVWQVPVRSYFASPPPGAALGGPEDWAWVESVVTGLSPAFLGYSKLAAPLTPVRTNVWQVVVRAPHLRELDFHEVVRRVLSVGLRRIREAYERGGEEEAKREFLRQFVWAAVDIGEGLVMNALRLRHQPVQFVRASEAANRVVTAVRRYVETTGLAELLEWYARGISTLVQHFTKVHQASRDVTEKIEKSDDFIVRYVRYLPFFAWLVKEWLQRHTMFILGVTARIALELAFWVYGGMLEGLESALDDLVMSVGRSLSRMSAAFTQYFGVNWTKMVTSGLYSRFWFPCTWLLLFVFCSIWPRCLFEREEWPSPHRPPRRPPKKERPRRPSSYRPPSRRPPRRPPRRRPPRRKPPRRRPPRRRPPRRKRPPRRRRPRRRPRRPRKRPRRRPPKRKPPRRRRPKRRKPRKRRKKPCRPEGKEDCVPEWPEKPRLVSWECVTEGTYDYLSHWYEALAEAYSMGEAGPWMPFIAQNFLGGTPFSFFVPGPTTAVSPVRQAVEVGRFVGEGGSGGSGGQVVPMSAIILWQALVNGAWVWAVVAYGIAAGVSVGSCLLDGYRWAAGYNDEEDGFVGVEQPHFSGPSEVERWLSSNSARRRFEEAHEAGWKSTYVRVIGYEVDDYDYLAEAIVNAVRLAAGLNRYAGRLEEDHYRKVLRKWLEKPRRELPKSQVLRALHPASSRGLPGGVSKESIAEVVLAFLFAALAVFLCAFKGDWNGSFKGRGRAYLVLRSAFREVGLRPHLKRRLLRSLVAAILGWAYGHFGMKSFGFGKLYWRADPRARDVCLDYIEALIGVQKLAEKNAGDPILPADIIPSSRNEVEDLLPASWRRERSDWAPVVKRSLYLARFICHCWLAWRRYWMPALLRRAREWARPKREVDADRWFGDEVLATASAGNYISKGWAPESVDRVWAGVQLMFAHAFNVFITRLATRYEVGKRPGFEVVGRVKEPRGVGKRYRYAGLEVRPHLKSYMTERTYRRAFATLPRPDNLIRRLNELVFGASVAKAWGGASSSFPAGLYTPGLRVQGAECARNVELVRPGRGEYTAAARKRLYYSPNPLEILMKFVGRQPYSMLVVWVKEEEEQRRRRLEVSYSCDTWRSGPHSSYAGTVGETEEEPSEKIEWSVTEDIPKYWPSVPAHPPEPPEPPDISDLLPKPPKPPQIECPEPPRPPSPPTPPSPPLPPQLHPPEWNPPMPPITLFNPPVFQPPQFPEEIYPLGVAKYLHDWLCSWIKYLGDYVNWAARFIQMVLEVGPTYLLRFLAYVLGYLDQVMEEIFNFIPAVFEYVHRLARWIESIPQWLPNYLSQLVGWFRQILVNYPLELVAWALRCAGELLAKLPDLIAWVKQLIDWFKSLLDPALWKKILEEVWEYVQEFLNYLKDLLEWAVKAGLAIIFGVLLFLMDLWNAAVSATKQAMKYVAMGRPLAAAKAWLTNFLEHYCGPDVLNSWRAAFYSLYNIPVTAKRQAPEIVAAFRAAGRLILADAYAKMIKLKRWLSEHGGELAQEAENACRDFVQALAKAVEPHQLERYLRAVVDRLEREVEAAGEVVSEKKGEILAEISRIKELLTRYFREGYAYWDYGSWEPKWTGESAGFDEAGLRTGLVATQPGSAVPSAASALLVERVDIKRPGPDGVGPLGLLAYTLIRNMPVGMWLYPERGIVHHAPPVPRLVRRQGGNVELVIQGEWPAAFAWYFETTHWVPMLRGEFVEKIEMTHPSEWGKLPEDWFLRLDELVWNNKFLERAARIMSRMFEALANAQRAFKWAAMVYDEAASWLKLAYYLLLARAAVLHVIRWTVHVLPSFQPWCRTNFHPLLDVYLELCRQHNEQVRAFNSIVREMNKIADALDRAIAGFHESVSLLMGFKGAV